MSEAEPKSERLTAAISDLEHEVDAKFASMRKDAAEKIRKLEAELASLRTKQKQMERDLKFSATQTRDLRGVAQTAGTRIDNTITGIKSLLAEDGGS